MPAPGYTGMGNSGIGFAENSRRHGFAIQRAQLAERPTRALSVAIPVLAYICRYSFEINRNATRARSERTQRERCQVADNA